MEHRDRRENREYPRRMPEEYYPTMPYMHNPMMHNPMMHNPMMQCMMSCMRNWMNYWMPCPGENPMYPVSPEMGMNPMYPISPEMGMNPQLPTPHDDYYRDNRDQDSYQNYPPYEEE